MIGLVLVVVSLWWQTGRKRSLFCLATAGAAVLSSCAAFAVLAVTDDLPDDVDWLTVFVLATGALGAVGLVLVGLSKPEVRKKDRTPPQRGPRNSLTWSRYRETRTAVLDILLHRGVATLDDSDRKRLLEIPLGYWDELDGVDEAERRRILELRFVGWRDFDEGDQRPWPPGDSA